MISYEHKKKLSDDVKKAYKNIIGLESDLKNRDEELAIAVEKERRGMVELKHQMEEVWVAHVFVYLCIYDGS